MSDTNRPTPLRVAVVGAGLMGGWHARFAAAAGARIVAIVDTDQPRAGRIAARHKGCLTTTDLEEAIAVSDVVHICTPTATHGTLVATALRAGRHVLVEKPLAASATETAELLDLASAHRVMLCPVHQFAFQDGVRTAAARWATIAPVLHLDFMICSAGATGGDDTHRDGVAIDVMPHPLSVMTSLLPGALGRMDWSARRPGAGEIRATGVCDDVSVSILISMGARPTRNRLEILGALGSMRLDLFHGSAAIHGGAVSRVRKVTQPFVVAGTDAAAAAVNLTRRALNGEPAYPGLRRLLSQVYQAIGTGSPCPIPAGDTLAVAEAVDAIAALIRSDRDSHAAPLEAGRS